MAATTTARYKAKGKSNSLKDVFPPTDRELALRGEIKTGWSTVALHQNFKNLGMSQDEMIKIENVQKRAEAVERVNLLRIGVELMKHEQNKQRQLGDGQRTCLICGVDFSNSHQYRRRPTSVHFCDRCSSAICSSCMLTDTRLTGETITLCPLCHEEKEIWKKSGAWFNNALPVIDIPQDELEQFEEQQKISQSRTFTLGKHTVETSAREFVNPYQLEAESSESEEEEELKSLQLQHPPSPEPPAAAAASSSFPPHIAFVDTPHLQQALQRPSPFKPASSSSFPRGTAPQSDIFSECRDRLGTSGSESEEPIGRRLEPLGNDEEGTQKIVRRGAMSTVDKTRLEASRKKALGSGSSQDTASIASGSPAHRAQNPSLSSSVASIPGAAEPPLPEFAKTSHKKEGGGRELPTPPRRPPPQLAIGDESDDSLKIDLSSVEVVVEPPTPKPLKTESPVKKKKKSSEGRSKPLEDEFKKVAVAPSSEPPILPPSKKPPVLTSSASDEFRKVGMVAVATAPSSTSKPPPPSKPAPVHEVDEFRKVVPKAKPPPRVGGTEHGETSSKELPSGKPVVPPRDEFRKVSPPKQVEETKRSPPPLPKAEGDEFHKVSVTKPALPPKMSEISEFRKVGAVAMAATSSSSSSSSSGRHVDVPGEKRRSVDGALPPDHGASSSPTTTSPPPLPAKPKHMQQQQQQESPRRPQPTPRSKVPINEDTKSVTSTSSLTSSQSSRVSPPRDSPPRLRQSPPAPAVRAYQQDSMTRSDEFVRSSVRRQGELDDEPEEEAFRFRSRSGAIKSGLRMKSVSPLPSQQQEQRQVEDSEKTRSIDSGSLTVEDFDDFQPRMRSRSGAFDSHTPPRGGSLERKSPQPPNVQLSESISEVQQSHEDDQEEMVKSLPSSSSDDFSHPRMRTRSKAFHGDSRRPRPQIGRRGSKEKESSPSSDDISQPRTRTRSRAFHGPKKFTRSPSPNPRSNDGGRAATDVQSSLEIPFSRPRSSSTGQDIGLKRAGENDRPTPSTKPDGEQ